ncbi:unnamed protein product [Thelazia callipaeda]|uniref:Uncharacterized protein n=1 Tax=Thelazia callipaeda TaxID=103827 RepID=A0A0N5D9W1_THECL|nr:unnamed protein product [Thelazia callipaeda]
MVTTGQIWNPYETYPQNIYIPSPYQGYNGNCAHMIITGLPCQQATGQWNLYPNYQLQQHNMQPYIPEVNPQIFMPYSGMTSGINPRLPSNFIDQIMSNSRFATVNTANNMNDLSTKLLAANILNDKNRFEVKRSNQ